LIIIYLIFFCISLTKDEISCRTIISYCKALQ